MTNYLLGSRIGKEVRINDAICLSCSSPLKFKGMDHATSKERWQCISCGIAYLKSLHTITDSPKELPKIIQPSKGEHR